MGSNNTPHGVWRGGADEKLDRRAPKGVGETCSQKNKRNVRLPFTIRADQ